MNMQESVLYIVLALLCVVIYLLISQRKNKDDGKNNEELDRLKDSLTSSISTMSSSFNTLSKDVTRDMRRLAKVMNFGVAYGLSAFGISQQTEMTREEGATFIESYFETYPQVRGFLDETVAKAKELGYAETLLGAPLHPRVAVAPSPCPPGWRAYRVEHACPGYIGRYHQRSDGRDPVSP